jgi:PAS domain S-box-containing protein
METSNIEYSISPNFTEKDIEILKMYFELSKKYNPVISEALTADLADHPLWGPIMKQQNPEQRKAQNEKSLAMQHAAIYKGKWEEYSKELLSQGVLYAQMNISYTDWYELIKMYKDYLLPYIKKDFADSAEKAILYLEGLSKFIDFAMYGIAEAYFAEKNRIIRANEERFRAIFYNSTDQITLIDREGLIILANQIPQHYKKEDIIGKSILGFQTVGNDEIVKKAVHSVFDRKESSVFETLHLSGEKKLFYSSSISPIFSDNGDVNTAVIISRDLSLQKEAEEEVKELNRSLERKVEERTKELRDAVKELESFSYSISHDLRSPLRAINGFTHILKDSYPNGDEEVVDAMNEIIDNTQRMGHLIDDLLEFSRLGRAELTKTTVEMRALVETVIQELTRVPSERKINITLQRLEKVTGDQNLLKQVLVNMIDNALKYTSKKEQAVIEIGSHVKGNNIIYYVKDNGAGFDMAYYGKLFSVFQRLHSATEYEGTGVGLALVQKIITKHSGKVWAEGEVGIGATFYFSLPKSGKETSI